MLTSGIIVGNKFFDWKTRWFNFKIGSSFWDSDIVKPDPNDQTTWYKTVTVQRSESGNVCFVIENRYDATSYFNDDSYVRYVYFNIDHAVESVEIIKCIPLDLNAASRYQRQFGFVKHGDSFEFRFYVYPVGYTSTTKMCTPVAIYESLDLENG